MSEGSNLTEKITETKRQTEELKNQLQNLIDKGKDLICPSQSKQNCIPDIDELYEHPIPCSNKAQIIKSYDKHSNNISTNIPTHKAEVQPVSPKKVKAYDVKDAREFMKKQKEKLFVRQKETQEEQRIKAEIKKKKLQELDKKTKELLSKNVQARRERSNSRDQSNFLRIDTSSNVNTNLRKAASMDKINVSTQRNPNLLYPSAPHYVKNSSINKKTNKDDPGKIVILSRNFTRKGVDNKTVQSNKGHTNISTQNKTNLAQISPNIQTKNNVEINNKVDVDINSPKKDRVTVKNKDEISTAKSSNSLKNLENIDQKGLKPTILFGSHEDLHILSNSAKSNIDSVKNILEYKSSNSSKSNSNITVKSPNLDKSERIEQTDLANVLPKVALNQNKKFPKILNGLPITTNILSNDKEKQPLNKCSVEIQTENYQKMYPKWLDEQPPQAYPFNFINTVKRKLQSATMQKPTTDIGIQSSLVERDNIPAVIEPSKSPDPKSVKKSDLRSFISHKCLNLDPKTIEHLELVSKKNYQDANSIFRNIQALSSTRITETESESDTSKNIPEISSESGTSLKKNAESVKKALMTNKNLTINTDRIDNMKLVPTNVVTNTVTIRTESKLPSASTEIHSDSKSTQTKQSKYENTLSVSDKYAADFDSDIDVSSESLDRSRRSIISHNKSGYNQVLIQSPEIIKSIPLSEKTDSSKHSVSDVNTEMILSNSIERISKSAEDKHSQNTERRKKIVKNISVRSSKVTTTENTNDGNQIHLKFEAEIHLLNDFNQSLRKFSEQEQVLENLKTKNNITTKILKNNEARTSFTSRSKTCSTTENVFQSKANRNINYSRGSNSSLEDLNILSNTALGVEDNSVISTGLEIATSIDQSVSQKTDEHLSNFENLHSVNFAGISINMFEQLIKDEDVRLENLKTILKIREQSLLDRITGELAWLEIQRKHFKETGQLHEASVIKKKQRGILVNHQKEKHEMQRLKQIQKAASLERKIVLKEQKNLIRQQLSTDNMLTKMKLNTPKERRQSGPLKVLQSHTESIRSETSISRRSSSDKEKDVVSVTSHHSVVSEFSEIEISSKDISSNEHRKYIKRTLLMRETALRKRQKAAEELLEWHKKLLEEEKRIAILESTASAIISQKPSTSSSPEKFNFKGKQLNQMWFNLTDSETKKFVDDKIYPMSQIALERFCKSAREYNIKSKTLLQKNSENNVKDSKISVAESISTQKTSLGKDYVSDFENDSAASRDNDVDESIDILINNFNKMQDDISSLSSIRTKKSDEEELDSESPKFDKTESEAEISVIETNRTDVKDKVTKTKDSSSVEEIKDTINESIPTINQDSSDKAKSDILSEKSSNSSSNGIPMIIDSNSKSERSKSEEILEESSKLNLSNEIPSIILGDEHTTQKTDISNNASEISQKSKPTTSNRSADQHHSIQSNTSITDDSGKTKRSTQIISKLSQDDNSPLTDPVILESSNINSLIDSEEMSKRLDQNSSDISLNKSEKLDDISVPLSVLQSSSKIKLSLSEKLSVEKSKSDVLTVSSKDKSSSLISDKKSITGNSSKSKTSSDINRVIIHSNITIKSTSNDIPDDISTEHIHKTDQTSSDNSKSDARFKKPSEPPVLTVEAPKIEVHSEYADQPSVEDHDIQKSSSKQIVTEEKDTLDEVVSPLSSGLTSVDDLNESFSKENILELIKGEGKDNKKTDQELIKDVPPIAIETKESLNESQEILHILGESEVKTSSDEEMPKAQMKESLNTSEEILSTLNNVVEEEKPISGSGDSSKTDEDLMSQSLLKLYQISETEKSKLFENNNSNKDRKSQDDSDKLLIYDFCDDLIESNVDETFENRNKSQRSSTEGVSEDFDEESAKVGEELKVEIPSNDIDEKSAQEPNLSFKIDENNENQTFLNNLVASSTEINFHHDAHDDSDESKFAFSDKSNESFVINDLNDDSNDKFEENNKNVESTLGEIEDRNKTNDYSSIMEEESENKTSHFSYGVLPKSPEQETSDSFETDLPPSKEEVNSFEEKEHDSLSSAHCGSNSEVLNLEEQSLATSESSKNENSSAKDRSNGKSSEGSVSVKSKSKSSEETSSKDFAIDVKKRVSEILADTNQSRGDKSPRLQDLYITTYDLISPAHSPEKDSSSPKDGHKSVTSIFDSEAEEILRKQLAVEEEIKAITEQQQKEQQLPLMYIREIPNKPPPPYTPPSSLAPVPVPTIIPTSDEIEEITMYSAKILHKAYLSNNLANVSISNNTLSLISKDISKDCYKFVFDLCKDIAREHYKRFEENKSPYWLHVSKKSELTLIKPLDTEGLKNHMIAKLKEIFGYQKRNRRENAIIKWSRKKRDHVDEILVMECQQEEAQWTNYQKDELLVKDQITNEIFDSLLKDTAEVFKKIFSKSS